MASLPAKRSFTAAITRPMSFTDDAPTSATTLAIAAWLMREEAPTQAEIARAAEMHPMQVSLVLKPLEAKGLLRRVSSLRRANAKEVELTVQGLTALRNALPLVIAVQRRMFGDESVGGRNLLDLLLSVEAQDAIGQPSSDD